MINVRGKEVTAARFGSLGLKSVYLGENIVFGFINVDLAYKLLLSNFVDELYIANERLLLSGDAQTTSTDKLALSGDVAFDG